jgi:hypothetical protein
MKQKIRMRFPQFRHTFYPLPEAYQFKPSTGWLRIVQRLCWRFLGRTGALITAGYDIEEPFKDIVIDTGDIIDRVMQAIEELNLGSDEVEAVYMGLQDYMELNRLAFGSYTYAVEVFPRKTFLGMPVVLVPWMEGLLVVPKAFRKLTF